MTDSYLFLAAAGAIALAALPASAAQQGQATGTVDGQSLDVALDCSNWGAQQYPSLAAADKNVLLEGTLFPDGRFALTWKPADYRYQLLFDDVGQARPSFELDDTFNSQKLGRSFQASIKIDCEG